MKRVNKKGEGEFSVLLWVTVGIIAAAVVIYIGYKLATGASDGVLNLVK